MEAKTKRQTKKPLRAVVVGGVRTPFIRSFGKLTAMDTIALGVANIKALMDRYPIDPNEINSVLWGGVILPGTAANTAREIVLDAGLPATIEATTMTRACTSSLFTIIQAVAAIERGEMDVVIAGGSDSTSNAEVNLPPSFVHKTAPVMMSSKSGPLDYLKLLTRLSPRKDLIPQRPSVRDRKTGLLMGEAAERMAARNGISREEQDALAYQSHIRAAAAIESGRFDSEVAALDTPRGNRIYADNVVRSDTTVEKLGKLRAAFAKGGTLTAGNSSSLTDGSSATLVMSEQKAKALGLTPLAAFKSWSFDAVDPADQMLLGPAFSMPRALARAKMAMKDIDLVDIHEAFAAQVLCVLKMLGSDAFAKERLGLKKAVGAVALEDINIHGGSIALGHPFAATGSRMVNTMANELHLQGKGTALLGICGQAGVSAGAVMEAV